MSAQPWEIRLANLEGAFTQVGDRLNSIERRLDSRFDTLDHKIDDRFDALDNKSDQRFMWTIGVVLATWLTTITSIFLHHRPPS